MRTRIAIAGAWILGTAVTSGLAWTAVSGVETHITTLNDSVVSPRDVDRALAPLAVSSTTELSANGGGVAPGPTAVTAITAPSTASAPPSTSLGRTEPPTTLPALPPAPPPTLSVTSTAPPKVTTTTIGAPPTVIPTIGGSIGVTCPTPSTIRLVYATPNSGYVYSPVEITPSHVQVKFTKNGQSIHIEAECSGGRVEASFGDDDD